MLTPDATAHFYVRKCSHVPTMSHPMVASVRKATHELLLKDGTTLRVFGHMQCRLSREGVACCYWDSRRWHVQYWALKQPPTTVTKFLQQFPPE